MARVLLIAPTCDRDDIGEAWVAHQWARLLGEQHDVTLLTYHKRGKSPARQQLTGMTVVEWTEPRGLGRVERFNSMFKPAYIIFYVRARRWIRGAVARGQQFDVAHQVTPVAARYPSPAAGFPFPLVMGPIGGGLEDPPGFAAEDTAPWYTKLRRVDRTRLRCDPWLRQTYSNAACVLGIAPYVADHLADVPLRRFEVMSETGLVEMPPSTQRRVHDGPLRLLFVGRLIRTKGARDAIAAMNLMKDLDLTLDIIGDGFDRAECESLVGRLGLSDRVRFHGQLPHDAVTSYYSSSDIFVFPSYREPGGNVVYEAMGAGLPLVVCARGGPGHVVDDSCGVRVGAVTPQQLARDLAVAIRSLADDPDRRERLGQAARERLRNVGLWEAKVHQAGILYAELSREGQPGGS